MVGTWRDMEGNVALGLATGKTPPTEASPRGKLMVNDFRWFHYPTELDAMVEFAEKNADRDLYLTPATYGDKPYMKAVYLDGKKTGAKEPAPIDRYGRPQYTRSKDNALQCAVIYMDSDSCSYESFRIPPSRHVDTSEGHGHDYWYLTDPIPAHEAAEIAHRITVAHKADGCDPTGWSENKVLRLPTVNTGYDELFPYDIEWWETDVVYDPLDISGAYDDVELTSSPAQAPYSRTSVPVPDIEGLPSFEEVAARIPATERRLNDLIYKVPKLGESGWRTQQRFALLLDMIRFGFTPEETIAVAWHSPAGAKWREDDRGIDGLWWELQEKVMPIIREERGVVVSTAVTRHAKARGPKIMTDVERSKFAARSDFHTFYAEMARTRVPVYNGPYHSINAVMLLSLAFGGTGGIQKGTKMMPVCFYSMTLGGSSTGKTEAWDLLENYVHALYPNDNPNLGSEHSKSALLGDLIARDKKVSLLVGDEFHGKLKEIKNGGWSTGIVETWTKIFDGGIPSLGRVKEKELNKAGVTGIVNFHAMGTLSGMLDILDRQMFYSGYLARNIFVIGNDVPVTEESMKTKQFTGDTAVVYDALPKYFTSVFNGLKNKVRGGDIGGERVAIHMTDEALERYDKAKWQIWKHFEDQWDMELWKTSLRRMFDYIWKLAALEAMSFGRSFIATSDIVTALGFVEIWLDTLVTVSESISDTLFSKQCDEIEKFVAGSKNKEVEVSKIYAFRKGEAIYITDTYLVSLTKQNRLVETKASPEAPSFYKVREV